jgi:predicted dienelactone hydrolase
MRHLKRFWVVMITAGMLLGMLPANAQRPDAPSYAERGDYPVGTREYAVENNERSFNLTVWYPAANPEDLEEEVTYQEGLIVVEGEALRDADPAADAPFPLVVFSHGSGGTRFQSVFFAEHLASYGFVVVAGDHPLNTAYERVFDPEVYADNILTSFALRPLDALRVIAFTESLTAEGGDLAGVIDMERIAVSGHSFGGYTALAVGGGQIDLTQVETDCPSDVVAVEPFCRISESVPEVAALRGLDTTPSGEFPPTSDPRVKAILLMAPALAATFSPDSMNAINVPAMTIVGTADDLLGDAELIQQRIGSNSNILVTLDHAGHYIFLDECSPLAISFGLFPFCSDQVWDMSRAHDIVNHLSTAFLLSLLKDDVEAAAALEPDAVDFLAVTFDVVQDN